jgi:4-amino-4-deoxy-L-arabinose transferase-like glycosyltransferase
MRETRYPALLLVLILLVYAVLGSLYAARTPAWQAPDEPAHYNYVRYVAQTGQFPVLQMGDYPHTYLEDIKSRHFPADMSIDSIRYEFHQPPLYYVLAAPVFSLTGGALLPLRLFSVLLGAGIVLLAYLIARRAYPARPALALGAAAFVAFLPQHLMTISQVGNDVLAELLLALVMFILVSWLMGDRIAGRAPRRAVGAAAASADCVLPARVGLGVLLGLALITKTTVYAQVGALTAGVLVWLWLRERASAARIGGDVLRIGLPAVVIALPWFIRNLTLYGWPDFFGLIRHDAVVVGQMRPAEYLAQFGMRSYLERFVTWTFNSFWGVFGWMGVWLDNRVYNALGILTAVIIAGVIIRVVLSLRQDAARPTRSAPQRATAARPVIYLFTASIVLAALVYVWYNVQFVQTQGRYLFPALIPIAVVFGLGWDQAQQPRWSRWIAAGLAVLAVALAAWGVLGGHGLPKWTLLIVVVVAAGLAVRAWLPRALDGLVWAVPYAALPLVALYALFGAIVPQLAR